MKTLKLRLEKDRKKYSKLSTSKLDILKVNIQ